MGDIDDFYKKRYELITTSATYKFSRMTLVDGESCGFKSISIYPNNNNKPTVHLFSEHGSIFYIKNEEFFLNENAYITTYHNKTKMNEDNLPILNYITNKLGKEIVSLFNTCIITDFNHFKFDLLNNVYSKRNLIKSNSFLLNVIFDGNTFSDLIVSNQPSENDFLIEIMMNYISEKYLFTTLNYDSFKKKVLSKINANLKVKSNIQISLGLIIAMITKSNI